MPSLDTIAQFVQVIDSGSFTHAARVLALPKSTLSQRIAQLEEELGVRLLQRSTRRLSLTTAGQAFLGHARAMHASARAAQTAVSRLREENVGRLRVTAPEASGQALFAPLVAAFRERYPRIELDFLVTDAHLDLVAEGVDLAFRTGRLVDSTLVSRRIAQVTRLLVASPAYLMRRGAPGSLDDLQQHDCLVHHPARRWIFSGETGDQEFETPPHSLSSNSLCFLQTLAERGAGIAMLPAAICGKAFEEGRLVRVLADRPLIPNDYYMLYPSRLRPTAAVETFMAFLEESGFAQRLSGAGMAGREPLPE